MSEWTKYFTIASEVADNMTGTINMNLTALMGGNLNSFWRYSGSLTVPPCLEPVIFSVFTVPIQFSDNLIAMFRTKILDLTYREPQPLNGRTVYRNFPTETASQSSNDTCCGRAIAETTTPGTTKTIRETNAPGSAKANALSSFVFLLSLSSIISLIM
jgi:hypothetical protein